MVKDAGKSSGRGRWWALAALVGLLVLSGYHLASYLTAPPMAPAPTPPVPVEVAPVRMGEMPHLLEQTGEVRPWSEVLVISKVKGQEIRQMLVDRGDRVTKGQVLARLDKRSTLARRAQVAASIEQARASLATAQVRLEMLQRDLGRVKALVGRKAAAQQKLDHTLAEYQATQAQARLAQAQIEAAQATLRQLDLALDDHVIIAPFDGVVSGRFQDPGSLSSDKEPMFRITDESRVKVITTAGESDYPLVKQGQAAQVQVDAHPGRVFKGQVSLVSPVLNPATRSADLEIVVDNPHLALRAGMYARVSLELRRDRGLLVPQAALNRLPGTGLSYVFVVREGAAHQVNLELGPGRGESRLVLKGLEEGQEVVVRGSSRLVNGSRVKVTSRRGED